MMEHEPNDSVEANATKRGDVSLMVPSAEANTKSRGIIMDTDQAIDVARDIFAAVDEALDDEEDDGVIYISGGGLPNGIYLIADTPRRAHPLATEGAKGDRALLQEALEEHGVDRVVDDGGSDE